jgi:hypothetical protein
MDLMEILPEDVTNVLTETVYRVSKISIVVFARVNKLCYRISSKCAVEHKICRSLRCYEIAFEGSLEILKWVRSEGCPWDSSTCFGAAQNGHLEILKWARSKGCEWTSQTENLVKQKWPNLFS